MSLFDAVKFFEDRAYARMRELTHLYPNHDTEVRDIEADALATIARAVLTLMEPFKVNADAFYAEELGALSKLLEDVDNA